MSARLAMKTIFGAVGQWMIAHSLGIARDEPGVQRFILQPATGFDRHDDVVAPWRRSRRRRIVAGGVTRSTRQRPQARCPVPVDAFGFGSG